MEKIVVTLDEHDGLLMYDYIGESQDLKRMIEWFSSWESAKVTAVKPLYYDHGVPTSHFELTIDNTQQQ